MSTVSATQMFQNLMGGQLEALAMTIQAQFPDVPLEKALEIARAHAATIDLKEAAKGKGKRGKAKGPRKPKAELQPEERCMARVWRSGSGKDQCSLRRGEHLGFDCYCKRHSTQAAVTEEPCTRGDDGYSHKGLWFGRIDKELPWLDANGVIAIEWDSAEHKEIVQKAVSEGTHKRHVKAKTFKGNKSKKTKKTKKAKSPTTLEDSELSTLLATTGGESKASQKKVVFKTKKAPVNAVDEAFALMDEDGDGVISKEEFAKQAKRGSLVKHIVSSEEAETKDAQVDLDSLIADEDETQGHVHGEKCDHETDVSDLLDELDQDENSEEEDEREVDERTDSAGKSWYVDGDGNAFDTETQEHMGTWNDDTNTVDLIEE